MEMHRELCTFVRECSRRNAATRLSFEPKENIGLEGLS